MDEEEPHTENAVAPIEESNKNANVKSIEPSLPGTTLEGTIEKGTIEKKAD